MERKLIRELAKRSTDEDSVIDWRWAGGKNDCWLHLDVGKIMGPVERNSAGKTMAQFCSYLNAGV